MLSLSIISAFDPFLSSQSAAEAAATALPGVGGAYAAPPPVFVATSAIYTPVVHPPSAVATPPPVYGASPPVYNAPAAVYSAPAAVYSAPPAVYSAPPAYTPTSTTVQYGSGSASWNNNQYNSCVQRESGDICLRSKC